MFAYDMGVHQTRCPIFPAALTDYLDELAIYQHIEPGCLDMLKMIVRSNNYYWKGYATPTGGNVALGALASFEDHVSVEPGSYITMIQGYCSNAAGFKFQIFDEGAKSYMYSRTWPIHYDVTGSEVATAGVVPFGPYILQSPMVILDPGLLTVEITNLAAMAANIQLLLCLAVPVTRSSLGQMLPQKAGVTVV